MQQSIENSHLHPYTSTSRYTYITLLLLFSISSFSQDLTSDTTAIRAILQANGIPDTVQIQPDGFPRPPPPWYFAPNGRVDLLNMDGLGLTSMTSEIASIDSLHTLFLNDNSLTSLPSEIGDLTRLSQLDLSGNQLTSLPSEIGDLTRLSQLDLSGNQLTSLPSEIGNLTQKITDFNFSDNQLITLPSTFGNIASSVPQGGGGVILI